MNSKAGQEVPLSIVIPAFNEQNRLPETVVDLFVYFDKREVGFFLQEVLIIDDGSLDRTLDVITDLKRRFPQIRLIHFSENQGKGAAVKAGLLKAQCKWVLIADADQSTPWSEIPVLYQAAQLQGADLVMGSRALRLSDVQVRQAWWREGMGKLFNKVVRTLFGLTYVDTQCGFKLVFLRPELRGSLEKLSIKRFAWDVEMILRFQQANAKIIEIPVVWRNKLNSRVHPIKDSAEMLYQLLKLRIKMLFDAARSKSENPEN